MSDEYAATEAIIADQHDLAEGESVAAMMERWIAEDALLDPEEAEADWEDFKAGMNAGRPPEYPVYPD